MRRCVARGSRSTRHGFVSFWESRWNLWGGGSEILPLDHMTLSEEVSGFVIFMGLGMRCLGQLGAEWVVEAAGGDAAAFARVVFRGDSHHSLLKLP